MKKKLIIIEPDRVDSEVTKENYNTWHILTVAEDGFSRLDIYGRDWHGIDLQTIKKFSDQINVRDEPGSLFPKAQISAMPRRYFRDSVDIEGFRKHIFEFFVANAKTIKANKILIDFRVCSNQVSNMYIEEIKKVVEELDGKGELGVIEKVKVVR